MPKPSGREMAIRLGHLDPSGFGRRVQARYCPRCGAGVLTGWTSEPLSRRVDVDPQPQDVWGELRALLERFSTYDLVYAGGRYELDHRDSFRIEGAPPGGFRGDVVVQHQCGRENRSGLTSFMAQITQKIVDGQGGEPPF